MASLSILCVGDVVGAPGRSILREGLKLIRSRQRIDCVVVNAENVAGGSGLTAPLYQKLVNYGVDLITLGDHIFRRKDVLPVLEQSDRIARPANLPEAAPGQMFAIHETNNGQRIAVISLLGRLFMRLIGNCPFAAVDRVLEMLPDGLAAILVDVHAEATGEKVALGWHLDGRVTAVFGTHTHIPTADETILPKGTAYVTDLGMCGPYDSILGRKKEAILSTMITSVPERFDVAEGDARLCGVIVNVDPATKHATSIERVRINQTDVSTSGYTEDSDK
ncbi:MAG: TIGR00282 family metallophosphoesterase [Phycisphaerae bacterium]|nr:TIGR00282 family metallophosphoesterase [Phycisphaerae bacterium]